MNYRFLLTSFKNSTQIIIRFGIGLLNIKLIALFLGPQGLTLFGQLQNALQIGSSVSSLGFSNGIIKYLSEFNNDTTKKKEIISTAFTFAIGFSAFLSVIVFLFSDWLSNYLFSTESYGYICQFIGLYLISSSIFNLIVAAYNGLQKLKSYIILNVVHSVSFLFVLFIGIMIFDLNGMFIALICQSFIAAICALWLFSYEPIKLTVSVSKKTLTILAKFSLIALLGGVVGPLVFILIRNNIIEQVSLHQSGIWEAVNKLSNSYVSFATGAFSYYFLPRFSSLNQRQAILKEVGNIVKQLVPLVLMGSFTMYLLRHELITFIFSTEFKEASQIIIWQIVGDFFKIFSWIIAYLVIAKAMVMVYAVTEVISGILHVSLTYVLVDQYGIEGSTMAYCCENILYLIMMLIVFYYYWGNRRLI